MKYHEVFFPMDDIYKLAGSDALKELQRTVPGERNLVIYPSGFNNSLDPHDAQRNREVRYLSGGRDALEALNQAMDQRLPEASAKEFVRTAQFHNVMVLRPYEGLDIAYINDRALTSSNIEALIKTDARIKKQWEMEKPGPTFITTRSGLKLDLKSNGLTVGKPEFLLADSDVVNMGIVAGSEEIYRRLCEAEGNALDARIVEDMLGKELMMSQYLKFFGGDRTRYARISGNLVKNRQESLVVGVEGRCVVLIPEQEYGKTMHFGKHYFEKVLSIAPKDMEQYLALQYGLLNPEASLFFLTGKAGSGKTLLTYASSIDQALIYDREIRNKRGTAEDSGTYERVILLKPNDPLGGMKRSSGLLPGDLLKKLSYQLRSYRDAHRKTSMKGIKFEDMFCHPDFEEDFPQRSEQASKYHVNGVAHLPAHSELIELTTSAEMPGRSIERTILILDEAQDFTPFEIMYLIHRMGVNGKLIVMGDPYQVKNPDCSPDYNGLNFAIKNYFGRLYCGLFNLVRNYRHQMSIDADEIKVFG